MRDLFRSCPKKPRTPPPAPKPVQTESVQQEAGADAVDAEAKRRLEAEEKANEESSKRIEAEQKANEESSKRIEAQRVEEQKKEGGYPPCRGAIAATWGETPRPNPAATREGRPPSAKKKAVAAAAVGGDPYVLV